MKDLPRALAAVIVNPVYSSGVKVPGPLKVSSSSMATAKVKLGVAPSNFAGISLLAHNVYAGLLAHPVEFPFPMPTLVQLQNDSTALDAAIATWGPVHNRGSHAQYIDLLFKANIMYNDLLVEAGYVESLLIPSDPFATQAAFIVLSGFGVKNLPTPQGVLGPPENFHRRMSDAISEDNIFLKWSKPLGLNSPSNVKSYDVFQVIGGIPTIIATVTATNFLVTGGIIHGNNYDFTVRGHNYAGDGVVSATLTVSF